MLQTTIESPHYWRELRRELGTVVSLFSGNAPDIPVSPEAAGLKADFVRLANDILDETVTVTFIRAHDTFARLRWEALVRYRTEPSDKLAYAVASACSMALTYLLSLRCLSAYPPPTPVPVPVANFSAREGGSSSTVVHYLAQEPMMAVVERLDSPPLAVAELLAAERAVPEARAPDAASTRELAAVSEAVHFGVSAPRSVAQGAAFIVDVWAFLAGQRDEVLKRAERSAADPSLMMRERGPARLARGSVLTVRLDIPGLVVDDAEDTLVWEGEITTTGLPVRVPESAAPGDRAGSVVLHAGGLQVAKLHFTVRVGAPHHGEAERVRAERPAFRTAFASYASENRDDVLCVLQGLQKALPGLDVFLDVARLRSGECWQDRLWAEIPGRDVFYLFWSEAASRSPWVEREWRCALETRGIGFIDPVPLVSPELVPPPRELGGLHFNDWMLAYKRGGRNRQA